MHIEIEMLMSLSDAFYPLTFIEAVLMGTRLLQILDSKAVL